MAVAPYRSMHQQPYVIPGQSPTNVERLLSESFCKRARDGPLLTRTRPSAVTRNDSNPTLALCEERYPSTLLPCEDFTQRVAIYST